MQVDVLMFAGARERAGTDVLRLDVGETATAQVVLDRLGQDCPALADLLPSCRLAVDSCYVTGDRLIAAGSEVALIPPVSGG